MFQHRVELSLFRGKFHQSGPSQCPRRHQHFIPALKRGHTCAEIPSCIESQGQFYKTLVGIKVESVVGNCTLRVGHVVPLGLPFKGCYNQCNLAFTA